ARGMGIEKRRARRGSEEVIRRMLVQESVVPILLLMVIRHDSLRLVLSLATVVVTACWLVSGSVSAGVWVRERTRVAIVSGELEYSEHQDHIRGLAREEGSSSWEFHRGQPALCWWFQHSAWGYGEAWAVPLWPLALALGILAISL